MMSTNVGIRRTVDKSKRNQYEVIANILETAVSCRRKTRIMYRCRLNYNQLQRYLDLAINHKLLESLPDKTYQTTPKGLRYLEVFEALSQSRKSFVKLLHRLDEMLAAPDFSNETLLEAQ